MEVSEPFLLGLGLVQPFLPTLLLYLSGVIKRRQQTKEDKSQLEFELLSRYFSYR